MNELRSLSDIDRSTAANDAPASALFSAQKNPQRIPAKTPPVFPGLRSCIWPHLLCLVTKAMSDRLLGLIGLLMASAIEILVQHQSPGRTRNQQLHMASLSTITSHGARGTQSHVGCWPQPPSHRLASSVFTGKLSVLRGLPLLRFTVPGLPVRLGAVHRSSAGSSGIQRSY